MQPSRIRLCVVGNVCASTKCGYVGSNGRLSHADVGHSVPYSILQVYYERLMHEMGHAYIQ